MKIILNIVMFLSLCACTHTSQFLKQAGSTLDSGNISDQDMILGLKQALTVGTSNSVAFLSKKNGYFSNTLYKITFPKEAEKVENTLRSMGMHALIDDTILSFNRAAEAASKQAKPIFINTIQSMTIADAKKILLGSEHAATDYFMNKTNHQLINAFSPVIQEKLDAVNATQYWKTVSETYNKIPMVEKVNTDLVDHVTSHAIAGMFHAISKEEEKIRDNPIHRTTAQLKKVFAFADLQNNHDAQN